MSSYFQALNLSNRNMCNNLQTGVSKHVRYTVHCKVHSNALKNCCMRGFRKRQVKHSFWSHTTVSDSDAMDDWNYRGLSRSHEVILELVWFTLELVWFTLELVWFTLEPMRLNLEQRRLSLDLKKWALELCRIFLAHRRLVLELNRFTLESWYHPVLETRSLILEENNFILEWWRVILELNKFTLSHCGLFWSYRFTLESWRLVPELERLTQ